MQANEKLKSQLSAQTDALQKAAAEHNRAVSSAASLQASLRESEEQISCLRTGFISLDEKNATLQQEHRALQDELLDCSRRLEEAEADKSRLASHAQELETQVDELRAEREKVWAGALTDSKQLHDSIGTATSQADSAVAHGFRAFESDGESHEILSKLHDQIQALRSDNERLQAELDDAQFSNDDLIKQLDAAREMVQAKDDELRAAAALAQEVAEAQQRLEADLMSAREEKILMGQVFGPVSCAQLSHVLTLIAKRAFACRDTTSALRSHMILKVRE
jgi:chromosome segregation ATPase